MITAWIFATMIAGFLGVRTILLPYSQVQYRVAVINPEHFQSFTVALKIKLKKKIIFPQTISAVC